MTVTVHDYGESYEYDEYDLCWHNLGAKCGNTGPKRWIVELQTDKIESPWVHGIPNNGLYDLSIEPTLRTEIDTRSFENWPDVQFEAEMIAVVMPAFNERVRYHVTLAEDQAVLYEHGVSQ